ncbi:15795_t:CDS:2, partial [Funneliformis geosporum]
ICQMKSDHWNISQSIYFSFRMKKAPKFSVADVISEVYGLPGIHECINSQKPLRAVIDIDVTQEDMEANGVKAQEVFI